MIADDIRANALPLYLSRPVTRTQYAAGKLAVLMTATAARNPFGHISPNKQVAQVRKTELLVKVHDFRSADANTTPR